MADASVERGKGFSKEKHKRKLTNETERVTSRILDDDGILWSAFQRDVDFSYQGALFYNNADVDKILSAGYWKHKVHWSFFLKLRKIFLRP